MTERPPLAVLSGVRILSFTQFLLGPSGVQFLAEAIKKAGAADSEKVSKALLGLTVDSPVGKITIREKDHQANRGQLYGKTVMDAKYPFAIMKPVEYVDPTKFME